MSLDEIKKKKLLYEALEFIAVLIMILGFVSFTFDPFIGVFGLGTGFGLSVYASKAFRNMSIDFKKTYIKKELEALVENAFYDPLSGFTSKAVYDTLLLKREDRFYSEDFLSGIVSGHEFRSSDIKLQDVRRSGKTTTVVTVFQGRFYEINLSEAQPAPVYIVRNNYIGFSSRVGMPRIDFEWIEFNKTFDVFSSNELEAFKLIKPRFMEQLVELKQIYGAIEIAFIDSKLYIAINNGVDSFDLRMFREINEKYVEAVKKEISDIKHLIETLT